MEPTECCISWCDVINAEVKTQKSVTSVVINHIEKQKDKNLRIKALNLTLADGEEEKLVATIQEQCSKSMSLMQQCNDHFLFFISHILFLFQ